MNDKKVNGFIKNDVFEKLTGYSKSDIEARLVDLKKNTAAKGMSNFFIHFFLIVK